MVPLVPGLSILINIYLICQLSGPTWIRFGVWLFFGMLIYLYCLFSGASDRAYALHSDDSASIQRKPSNVSVNEHLGNTAY